MRHPTPCKFDDSMLGGSQPDSDWCTCKGVATRSPQPPFDRVEFTIWCQEVLHFAPDARMLEAVVALHESGRPILGTSAWTSIARLAHQAYTNYHKIQQLLKYTEAK